MSPNIKALANMLGIFFQQLQKNTHIAVVFDNQMCYFI